MSNKDKKPKSGEKTYKLKHPFDWGTNDDGSPLHITELVLSRPKGRDVKGMGRELKLGELMTMAAKCSGQPMAVLNEMDAEDCIGVSEVIGDFLGSGQETGEGA